MDFNMIENAKRKYVGKRFKWRGREIIIINCFSCYDGDFFEYYFVDDANKRIERVSMFDPELLKFNR